MDKWGSSCLKLQAIISNNEHKSVGNEWKKVGGKLINYFYFGMNITREEGISLRKHFGQNTIDKCQITKPISFP